MEPDTGSKGSEFSQKVVVAKDTPRLEENLQRRARIRARRATKILTEGDPQLAKLSPKQRNKIRTYQKWWKKESVKYAFCNPHVRAKLEKLMSSNIVSITDRIYMQRLMERIAEEHAEQQDKRIQARMNDEMSRVKKLVLSGIIPLNQAPSCMADHPVMIIERICAKIIKERRAKIKYGKHKLSKDIYKDDSPDLPSGLTIVSGHKFAKEHVILCHALGKILDIEEETDNYMYTVEEYERLKYESPLIYELRLLHRISELYDLADELVGYMEPFDTTPYKSRPSDVKKPLTPSIHPSTQPSDKTPLKSRSLETETSPLPLNLFQPEMLEKGEKGDHKKFELKQKEIIVINRYQH